MGSLLVNIGRKVRDLGGLEPSPTFKFEKAEPLHF